MNKFQTWLLKRITKNIVIQGWYHKNNIMEYYKIINDACKNEFKECSTNSLNSLLKDCHKESIK